MVKKYFLIKLKLIFYTYIIFLLVGCNNSTKERDFQIRKKQTNKVAFQKLENKFITGDFDGDNIIDTLNQTYFSRNIKNTLTEIPVIDDHDSLTDYYFKNDIQATLKSKKTNLKNLDLGICFGTYSLINIRDNNNDHKDEIALVIDYCDFSVLNSCKIYSFCNNDWKLLNQFNISENAFFYAKDEKLNPNIITGFLEKKKNKWFYTDYLENLQSDNPEIETLIKPLKIKSCN
jgi:hypothetical protein